MSSPPAQKKQKTVTSSNANATDFRCRVRNAAQLVVVCDAGERIVTGAKQSVKIIENGGMVIGHDGFIVAAAAEADIDGDERFANATFDSIVDATGKSVVPGFCDGHTHPVWTGDRTNEFAMKLGRCSG
jgi:imidazolonepropionase